MRLGMSPTSLTPRSHDHYLHLLEWFTLSSGMYYSLTPRSHDHLHQSFELDQNFFPSTNLNVQQRKVNTQVSALDSF